MFHTISHIQIYTFYSVNIMHKQIPRTLDIFESMNYDEHITVYYMDIP